VALIPRQERTPEEAMSLFGSPVLRQVPERWLFALLNGGDVLDPGEEPLPASGGAYFVLTGCLSLRCGGEIKFPLQRGDLFHPSLLPDCDNPELLSTARWTRLLYLPDLLYHAFLKDTGMGSRLERLYRTRRWWRNILGEEPGLDVLAELAQLCKERRLQPGDEIVRQGQPANNFFVVTEGTVEVLHTSPAGETRTVGAFSVGYHFGEIALLGQEVRTATVRAQSAATVLELPGRAFRQHLMAIPLARYHMCQVATQRKRDLMAHDPVSTPGI
jgi:hypothetical protein